MATAARVSPVKILAIAAMIAASCMFCPAAIAGDAPSAIPQFADGPHCPGDRSAEMKYDCDFLAETGAKDLRAPKGARVYRETWMGPFMGPMHEGSIVLTIAADGSRTLRTPWRRRPYHLKPGELPDFEATLAKSTFAQKTVYNRIDGVCVDGVATAVEAVVDGKYHLVLFDFCGGVFDEDIAQALDQLFVFAAGLSGRHYPVNADHPTFRG